MNHRRRETHRPFGETGLATNDENPRRGGEDIATASDTDASIGTTPGQSEESHAVAFRITPTSVVRTLCGQAPARKAREEKRREPGLASLPPFVPFEVFVGAAQSSEREPALGRPPPWLASPPFLPISL